jgi:hypothetical protein
LHVLEFAFPDYRDRKSAATQFPDSSRITLLIGSEFSDPRRGIRFGNSRSTASFMMMPETSMYKNSPLPRLVGEIWRPRKRGHIQSIARAEAPQNLSNRQLGSR